MILPLGDEPNPPGVPVVTYALILVNCAAYLFVTLPLSFMQPDPGDPLVREYITMVFESMSRPVSERGAQVIFNGLNEYALFVFQWGFRPAAPQVQDLFTAMFLHGGFLHLAGNMLYLWICGDNVEHRLGRARFLAAYLGTGVAATLFFTLFAGRSPVPMLGASGAISGVLGFYFIWFPRNRVRLWVVLFPFFMNVVHVPARWALWLYLIGNLLPFLASAGTGGAGVAYGAHIGGFLGGLAVAWGINRRSLRVRPTDFGTTGLSGAAPPPEGSLAALIEEGDYEAAATRYFALPVDQTRRLLNERHSLLLGNWMAAKGHARA
ncbi:MAG: rhomboid family intramembrane serine protease, partial [Vicinamibacterales bacterium]|nr:rhomboid family intramembrane serine protease [Vicinamibacterales bacterium]